MAYDKVVDSARLDKALTATADSIRAKTGESTAIPFDADRGFADAVAAIRAGGGSARRGEVNFYDYDGSIVFSCSVAEARSMTALPETPAHDGLVFQRWNTTLDAVNALTRARDFGATYTTDDGKTRIHIHLEEGRTEPMLGVCPNGTVTVDWGDGTDAEVLTGTSVSTEKWTSNHAYAAPGDYMITLTVEGSMGLLGQNSTNTGSGILRYSGVSDNRNKAYQNAVRKVFIGDGVTSINGSAFNGCSSLNTLTIPDSVTNIGAYAFFKCFDLNTLTIPDGVTIISAYAFSSCSSLNTLAIPDSVTRINGSAFNGCSCLNTLTIPDSVTIINNSAFGNCTNLNTLTIPDGVTSINNGVFGNCYSLNSLTIPDGVTIIDGSAFNNCYILNNLTIPDSVTSIGSKAFSKCHGVRFYDFTAHTSIPTLSAADVFEEIAADCEIRVPAALYDEWIAATNWITYADYIVAI